MKAQKLIGIVALILLCSSVFALVNQETFEWKSMAKIVLDKKTFSDSEPIMGKIIFDNVENYPSLGTKIVLHLAKGEYFYPSQMSSNDNVIEEKIINMDFVLPVSTKDANFSLANPGQGEFRIDAYVWVVKSKAIGASNIFYNPISEKVSVTGGSKERAVINHSLTNFENNFGPIGFPVEPESKFKGVIVIDNPTSVKKSNLILGIKLCEWASAFCGSETETKFNVPEIEAGSKVSVNVELTAPKIPSAYEIGIVLTNGNESESVFKSRVIVSGGTAKIRKIFLNGIADRNYSINLIVMGSPDHFAYPDFDNFESKLEVYDGTKLIEEKSISTEKIKTGEVIENNYLIDANFFTKFCGKIIKSNVIYENECFEVDLNRLLTEYDEQNPPKIKVDWDYDDFSRMLSLTLNKKKINAQIRVFDSEQTYLNELIDANNEYNLNLQIEKINLFLMINDFDAKRQQLIPLNLALLSDNGIIYGDTNDPNANIINQKRCTGNICQGNTVCSTDAELTLDGDCCYTKCVPAGITFDESLMIPLILWVALILLIVAGLIVYGVNKRRKRK